MHLLIGNLKKRLTVNCKCAISPIVLCTVMLIMTFFCNKVSAQCSTATPPTYTETCLYDYFTSVSAFGTGITSTISVSASSCSVTYTDLSASQGISALIGRVVNIDVHRCATLYTAFLSVYVDWNNDGSYNAGELAGSMMAIDRNSTSATYTFTVPDCGVVTGVPLHMRLMLSESPNGAGAPCTANYGESLDFYFEAICPAPMTSISITPSSSTICPGSNTSLTVSGGVGTAVYTWTPSTGLSATTGSSTTASPSATTVYTVSVAYCSGCGTSTEATATVTVLPIPAIGVPSPICVGTVASLSTSISGGTWSFSDPSIATVHPTAGVLTGVSGLYLGSGGTLTYTPPNGCRVTTMVYVTRNPPPIIGPTTVCEGGTIVLSDTASYAGTYGGVWSSSNTAIAGTGFYGASTAVAGVSVGTALISFQFQGCYATTSVTVVQAAGAISGASTVCLGTTIPFSSSTSGGTWGGGSGIASVNSSTGAVTAAALGTAIVSYTHTTGCVASKTVTIVGPSAIGGSPAMCTGSNRTLSNATGGGTWTSSNTSVATISSGGVVTPVAAGNTNITYTVSGCSASMSATVFATPSAISGPANVCEHDSVTLSDAIAGGSWSSNNTGIATINSSGELFGVSTGSATISYTVGVCTVTKSITVDASPWPLMVGSFQIGASRGFCVGGTATITSHLSGGTWHSSNPSVAPVSSSGVVTGLAVGSSIITYTVGNCSVSFIAYVGC